MATYDPTNGGNIQGQYVAVCIHLSSTVQKIQLRTSFTLCCSYPQVLAPYQEQPFEHPLFFKGLETRGNLRNGSS